MNPYMEVCNNPYSPSTGGTGSKCYGNWTPKFERGTGDEVVVQSCNVDGPNDSRGNEISGDSVYIKGVRIVFTGGENDGGTTAVYPNMYRIMVAQVNQTSSHENSEISPADWASMWRVDSYASASGNGAQLRNTMMAYRNRDSLSVFRIIRDTKWMEMKIQVLNPASSLTSTCYKPVKHDFYIPINKRFTLDGNNIPIGFNCINWCIMGTWVTTGNCPDFEMRLDYFYKD